MLRQMPASLLAEWMAFNRLEPVSIGQRAEAGSAIVAAVLANVNRDPKRKREAYQADDFMPGWGRSTDFGSGLNGSKGNDPEPQEVWKKVKMWAERYK